MHLIRQHTFDIDCPSKNFGKEIHGQLGALLEQHFYPKLEKILNTYTPHNHTWSIETLELELPDISVKDWKKELVEHSLQQIEQYLLANKPFVEHSFRTQDKQAGNVIKISVKAETLFVNFLKTGILPENAVSNNLTGILDQIEITGEFAALLLENFERDTVCLIRWILGVPNVFKEEVCKVYASFPKHFTSFINDIFKQETNSKSTLKLNREWIEFLQWMMVLYKQSSQDQRYINEIIQLSGQYWSISGNELSTFVKTVDTYFKSKRNLDEYKSDTKTFFEKLSKSIEELKAKSIIPKEKSNSAFNATEKIQEELRINSFDNAHYIDNAGLIIVHPFLQSLFEQLGLYENDSWKSESSIHKAVLLTQYLVTGQELFFENELILNKLLCGLELDTIINTKLKITKKDKEKCHSLLTAILEYWKPMNNSSIEALQETFLQRDGKLEQAGSYELWIEERGYDILLAQLPWGITMIKTPWMEEYLTCNWT